MLVTFGLGLSILLWMSEFERLQIESLLQPKPEQVHRGTGLFVMPAIDVVDTVYHFAVRSAFRKNEIDASRAVVVFHSESLLSEIAHYGRTAEVIVVELTTLQPELMYVLGMCHGIGRCPILLVQKGEPVPFNLQALRCLEYEPTRDGFFALRENLERAVRTFLSATRAS
jgi:hypothetical protein